MALRIADEAIPFPIKWIKIAVSLCLAIAILFGFLNFYNAVTGFKGVLYSILLPAVAAIVYLWARACAPIEKIKVLQNELASLKTPRVSLDLFKIDRDLDGVETIFLQVTGLSTDPQNVRIKATSVEGKGKGPYILHLVTGEGLSLSIAKDETIRSVPVVRYDPNIRRLPAMDLVVPCEIHGPDIRMGHEYFVQIKAFGVPCPAMIEFAFGKSVEGGLWYQRMGTEERIDYFTPTE